MAAALDIDTVFVDPSAMERVWELGVEYSIGGCLLRCASLDIMLGTKLHAIRHNEAVCGRRDIDDVLRLLTANNIDPAGDRFRRLCDKYATTELYDRLCQEHHNSATN